MTDQNLLFGLMALQLDFITRDDLIAALQAWMEDKQRPLGGILAEKGCLSETRRQLLEPLVAEHVRQHRNDARQSLAAISAVTSSVRDALKQLGDDELSASVAVTGTAAWQVPPPAEVTRGPSSMLGGRFRVLRPHAKGGLGEVSVALDHELNREVALKEIQSRFAQHDGSRARFLLEAEITGQLEHPGIVPVYGLGHYADGRPFYAMRLVRGDSLKDAIQRYHHAGRPRDRASHGLELRKLLGRFVDVCDAVEYAHSRGVLHRDLKPGNVMLGKYGETLVVDWGLAKTLGQSEKEPPADEPTLRLRAASGSEPTQLGSAIGTPSFMSPEQASGELDRVTRASDVYSLGATLYMLLTGRPPFDPRDDMILPRVQRGDFPHPREVQRDVPAALEAVCLRAMALRPADRYTTPRALADDIEHWLADEPVSAWREPLAIRARRWVQRHRMLVTSAAVAVLVASLSLAVLAVVLAAANRREREARAHATENFQLAFDSVNQYLTRVSESQLRDVPNLQVLRRELLDAARGFYQRFVDQRGDDPLVRAELGRAYLRLAQIQDELGSPGEAVRLARRGIAVLEALSAASPTNRELHRDIAAAHSDLGLWCHRLRDADMAESAHRATIHILEALTRDDPLDSDALSILAKSWQGLGMTYAALDRVTLVEPAYKTALELNQRVIRLRPGDLQAHALSATLQNNLGQYYVAVGDVLQAENCFRAAVDRIAPLIEQSPEAFRTRFVRATLLLALAELYRDTARVEEAERGFAEAVSAWNELAAKNPAVPAYSQSLVRSHVGLAALLRSRGRRSDAEARLRQALEIAEKLAAEYPELPEHAQYLAVVLNTLSGLLIEAGRMEDAAPLGQRATDIATSLGEQHPDVANFQSSDAVHNEGLRLISSGQFAEAEVALQQNKAHHRQRVNACGQIVNYRLSLAWALNSLAALYQLTGRLELAEDEYREAIEQWRALVQLAPARPDVQQHLGMTLGNLAGLQLTRGQAQQAAETMRESLNLLEPLVEGYPQLLEYAITLGGSYGTMGQIARNQEGAGEAIEWYDKSIRLLKHVFEQDPHHTNVRAFLRNAHDWKATALLQTGRLLEAMAEHKAAAALSAAP